MIDNIHAYKHSSSAKTYFFKKKLWGKEFNKMSKTIRPDQITDLENKIKELEKRMPAHSVPATLMQELEDLEEELALLKQGGLK